MTDDGLQVLIQEHIDHLLASWHQWASSERWGNGYPQTAAGCGQYRVSRQYDFENGAMDRMADIEMSKAVDRLIRSIPNPHHAALCFEAKNLCSPVKVWRAARVDQEQAARIIAEARNMLWMKLVAEDLA